MRPRPGAAKLYDLMWENHQKADELIQWKRSYDGGPLDHGAKVTDFVDKVESIGDRVTALEKSSKDDLVGNSDA